MVRNANSSGEEWTWTAIDKNWFAPFNRMSLCSMFIACTVWIPMWFLVYTSMQRENESRITYIHSNTHTYIQLRIQIDNVFISTCVGILMHHLQFTHRFHSICTYYFHSKNLWKQKRISFTIHLILSYFPHFDLPLLNVMATIFSIWATFSHNLFLHTCNTAYILYASTSMCVSINRNAFAFSISQLLWCHSDFHASNPQSPSTTTTTIQYDDILLAVDSQCFRWNWKVYDSCTWHFSLFHSIRNCVVYLSVSVNNFCWMHIVWLGYWWFWFFS